MRGRSPSYATGWPSPACYSRAYRTRCTWWQRPSTTAPPFVSYRLRLSHRHPSLQWLLPQQPAPVLVARPPSHQLHHLLLRRTLMMRWARQSLPRWTKQTPPRWTRWTQSRWTKQALPQWTRQKPRHQMCLLQRVRYQRPPSAMHQAPIRRLWPPPPHTRTLLRRWTSPGSRRRRRHRPHHPSHRAPAWRLHAGVATLLRWCLGSASRLAHSTCGA